MSLEDAIKEVAAAIRYYADVHKETADKLAEAHKETAGMLAVIAGGYEENDEPAPVLSLAEKRKEKEAAEAISHKFEGTEDPGAGTVRVMTNGGT